MLKKIRDTLAMIKFSHSIFALPFALAAMIIAADGLPSLKIFLLIVATMVTARNTAMSFNRYLDAEIDAQNPRTQNRHIPQGILSKSFVLGFCVINAALFIGITSFLNPLAFRLSPLILLIIMGYSWMKRWTPLTHLVLGLALGMAPVGAWIAVRGEFHLVPIVLGLAVLFWVAGFDILYAMQDWEHDQKVQLQSIVTWLGKGCALWVSRLFHFLTVLIFIALGLILDVSWIYYSFVGMVGGVLAYEQSLVKTNDLSKINMAFFTINGWTGVLFLAGILLEWFLILPS